MARKAFPGGKQNTSAAKGQKTAPAQPKPLPANLSPRHAAFVDNYMVHYNGSRAAREAGYSKRSASPTACAILANQNVKAEIIRRRSAMAENLESIANERIQYELAAVGLANMQDMAPMFGDGTPAEKLALLTREQAAAVQEIVVEEFRDGRSDWREVRRTKFKMANKTQALELLAKTKGMLVERVDHTHLHSGTIVHAMLKEIDDQTRGRPIVDVVALPAPAEAVS